MSVNDLDIPPNAIIRKEFIRCGNPDCQTSHGPYLYAYWKQDKKLKKRYVGKNLEDFRLRRIAKEVKLNPNQYIKFMFIEREASKGCTSQTIPREIKKGRSKYRLGTQSINQ